MERVGCVRMTNAPASSQESKLAARTQLKVGQVFQAWTYFGRVRMRACADRGRSGYAAVRRSLAR